MNTSLARISYSNADPFFYKWPVDRFPLQFGPPRRLSEMAKDKKVMAGPLPLVDCWKLEKDFLPLGNWGISAQGTCPSVLLLSHMPLSQIDDVLVGCTHESSTSVELLRLLIQGKYGKNVHLKRGLEESDEAWLIIGDQALQYFSQLPSKRWPHVTDLVAEWWEWQKLPFTFAQWVVDRNCPPPVVLDLIQVLNKSLAAGLNSLNEIAEAQAARLNLGKPVILKYLRGFNYHLGDPELAGIQKFRTLLNSLQIQPLATS